MRRNRRLFSRIAKCMAAAGTPTAADRLTCHYQVCEVGHSAGTDPQSHRARRSRTALQIVHYQRWLIGTADR
jgi:hypothetical protein